MATIDSLDIQIQASAQKANQEINKLVSNINRLAKSLRIDTSSLADIGKGLNLGEIGKTSKNMQSQAQRITKSLSEITEQYKDLGKGFEIKGSTEQIQKQIESLTNQLSKAKLAKEDFEMSGKTDLGGYETAVKNVIKYTNQIESLEKQLAGIQSVKPTVDLKMTGVEEAKSQISDISEKIKTASVPKAAFNYNPEAMKAVFGEMTAGIENWSQATQQFGANASTVLNQTATKTDELKSRTEQFEQSLKRLQIPPINTNNISVLQRELSKAENNIGKLQAKLANGITMGRISSNVGGKGFRDLREQIAIAEKQAEELRQKIKEVGKASGGGDVGKLGKELSNLSTNGSKAGNSLNKASGSILNLSSRASSSVTVINKMANSLRGLMRTLLPILGIHQLFSWGKQSMQVASDLAEIQNVTDTTFADMSYKVEDFAKTSIEQFGLSELALKQYSSRFQSMGVAMGVGAPLIGQANSNLSKLTDGYIEASDSMADVSLNLTKLTADMASFYNVEQDVVAEKLASVFTGQARPLRDFGLDLTQATLQEWALKQGMDANIQSMSQAEKTMLRYQYIMANTAAVHNDFSRTSGSWANQVRILSQNFQQLAGIVGGVLVNAFKPVISVVNAAMSAIIAFAKTISNALGKIFGWTYEEGGGGIAEDFDYAAGAADNLAGSTGQAAKNAKELNKYIAGWHEVNNMTSNADSSGGGGGGGGAGGGGAAGDAGGGWVKGESILKQFESEIDNLYELGAYIGKVLTDAMNNIDWDSVYEKARNFGSGLAEFLNGLFSPELFGAVGRTIAGSLNTALHFLDSFGGTFDWVNFGNSIAAGINNFFDTFDFGLLAHTINVWVQGVWDTIKTAIANIKWGDVWDGIKNFLNNIDLETIAIIVGAITIKKIIGLHLASTALSFIGKTLSQKIAQAIAGELGVEIASNAGIGVALATGLKAAFSSISGMGILDIGTVLGAGTLAEKFAFISKMIGGIGLVIGGAITAVKNFFDMWQNGFSWLKEALMVIGASLVAVGAVILGAPALVAGVVAGIVAAVATAAILVKEHWEEIKQFFSSLWEGIKETAVEKWNNISDSLANLWNGVKEKALVIWEGLKDLIARAWDEIKQRASEYWDLITNHLYEKWESIKTSASERFEQIKSGILEKWEGVKTKSSEIWDNTKETTISLWDKMKESSSKTFSEIKNRVVDSWNSIKESTANIWNNIKDSIKGPINAIIGFINRMIDGVVGGINGMIETLNGVSFDIPDWVPNVGGKTFGLNIPHVSSKVHIPQLAKGGLAMHYTPAVIGESGMEAVLPLTNKHTMGMIADSIYENASHGNSNNYDLGSQRVGELIVEMRYQNRFIQEQNELLRAIYEKPTLSDDDVFNSTRRGQRRYQNRMQKTGWAGVD